MGSWDCPKGDKIKPAISIKLVFFIFMLLLFSEILLPILNGGGIDHKFIQYGINWTKLGKRAEYLKNATATATYIQFNPN